MGELLRFLKDDPIVIGCDVRTAGGAGIKVDDAELIIRGNEASTLD